jgi:hypothetical protein
MDWTRANNVAQLARVESSNKFAFTVEARHELLDEANHLSRFHVTGGFNVIPLLPCSLCVIFLALSNGFCKHTGI